MKIWNFGGRIESACVVFNYRGYSLSLSSIAKPNEMLIFPSESSHHNLTEEITGQYSLRCTVNDIVEAKRCIDLYIGKAA